MTWGTKSNYSTQHLDAGSDSPASAREDIKKAIDELSNVIDGLNTTGGAAKIDTDGKVIVDTAKSTDSNTDITLDPGTGVVKIQDVINLNPVAYASLPASPAKGDVAFLTTDEDGDARNMLIVYNGSAWTYVHDNSAVVD
tara:strand:- start:146 stop:565 length:420 start_codon:yes stop_codon:yes gene_type:complete